MAAPFTETGCHVGTRLKAGRRGRVRAASAFETTWSIDATAGAGPVRVRGPASLRDAASRLSARLQASALLPTGAAASGTE